MRENNPKWKTSAAQTDPNNPMLMAMVLLRLVLVVLVALQGQGQRHRGRQETGAQRHRGTGAQGEAGGKRQLVPNDTSNGARGKAQR